MSVQSMTLDELLYAFASAIYWREREDDFEAEIRRRFAEKDETVMRLATELADERTLHQQTLADGVEKDEQIARLERERDEARERYLRRDSFAIAESVGRQAAEAEVARLREALKEIAGKHAELQGYADDAWDYGEHVGLARNVQARADRWLPAATIARAALAGEGSET